MWQKRTCIINYKISTEQSNESTPSSSVGDGDDSTDQSNSATDDDRDCEIVDLTEEPQPPVLMNTQSTIPELFRKMIDKEQQEIQLMSNKSYLERRVSEVIDDFRGSANSLALKDFVEEEENGYQSVFDARFMAETTFQNTIEFIQLMAKIMDARQYEVFDHVDLLLKYNWHGLRATMKQQYYSRKS
eukprot:184962_1